MIATGLEMPPMDLINPHAAAHHCETSDGDTFGGLGTSKEYREEDIATVLVPVRPAPDKTSLTDIQQAFVRRYMNDDECVLGVRIREIDGNNVISVQVADRENAVLPSEFCGLRVEVRVGRPAILAYHVQHGRR